MGNEVSMDTEPTAALTLTAIASLLSLKLAS